MDNSFGFGLGRAELQILVGATYSPKCGRLGRSKLCRARRSEFHTHRGRALRRPRGREDAHSVWLRRCRPGSLRGLAGSSAPPVIPERAGRALFEVLAPVAERLQQHVEMLPQRVEMGLARGRHKEMPVQNDEFLVPTGGELLQSLAEFDLFGGVKLLAEPAQFAEHACFTENKRTG